MHAVQKALRADLAFLVWKSFRIAAVSASRDFLEGAAPMKLMNSPTSHHHRHHHHTAHAQLTSTLPDPSASISSKSTRSAASLTFACEHLARRTALTNSLHHHPHLTPPHHQAPVHTPKVHLATGIIVQELEQSA